MKITKRKKMTIIVSALVCILMLSCARERGRTDINLEMTDEDSVEAIIDQDLLTAGGTIVNLEEPEQTADADSVAEVEEVELQNPVVVETDELLKPAGDTASTDSDEQPAMGLIDIEDVQIDSVDKSLEEDLSAKKSDSEVLSTEELIAENKALINAEPEPKNDAVEKKETPVDENALPGENIAATSNTIVEEVSIEEMTFPEENASNTAETVKSLGNKKIERPAVQPTAVRPPGGGYYTEYTTMDKTKKTVKKTKPVETPSCLTHTVKRGDTLWLISRKYGCTISELVAANNISRRSVLKIGQILKIPANNKEIIQPATEDTAVLVTEKTEVLSPATAKIMTETVEKEVETSQPATEIYTVKSGDSYWKIAKRYGITSTELMSLNNTSSSMIRVGQKILVPRR